MGFILAFDALAPLLTGGELLVRGARTARALCARPLAMKWRGLNNRENSQKDIIPHAPCPGI
jgi:hypothetical protein